MTEERRTEAGTDAPVDRESVVDEATDDEPTNGDPTDGHLTDDELADLADLARAATPGPWHVRLLDDEHAMSLVAVSTAPDTGRGERWPDFDRRTIVAATLVQQPRYVGVADERWDENAAFIAAARDTVPRLLAEVARLRALLADP